MRPLPAGYRVNWWAVVMGLHRAGWSLPALERKTGIPKSTIIGFKNLNVEPKHQDADALLQLFERECDSDWPLQEGSVRIRARSSGVVRTHPNQLWLLPFDPALAGAEECVDCREPER